MMHSTDAHTAKDDKILLLPIRRSTIEDSIIPEPGSIEANVEKLKLQTEMSIRVMRFLWIMDTAATVAGVAMKKPEVAAVGAASATLALLGTGMVRARARTLTQTLDQCRSINGCDVNDNNDQRRTGSI